MKNSHQHNIKTAVRLTIK